MGTSYAMVSGPFVFAGLVENGKLCIGIRDQTFAFSAGNHGSMAKWQGMARPKRRPAWTRGWGFIRPQMGRSRLSKNRESCERVTRSVQDSNSTTKREYCLLVGRLSRGPARNRSSMKHGLSFPSFFAAQISFAMSP